MVRLEVKMLRRNTPRILVLVTAVLLFGAIMMVPRIIEASKSSAATANSTNPVQGRGPDMTVGESIRNDTSPPIREMKQMPVFKPRKEANENPKIPHPHRDTPDRRVQTTIAADEFTAANMPTANMNFDGMQFPGVACNCAPPDTNGEVGATQYVQMVNEGFQVFNKTTGASLLGPSGISTVWGGFGGVCEFNGSGDPVVMYDQLADRWIISQFAGVSVPTDECVAVSTTGDATGSYHRYDFHLGSNFFDYPHLSVWPDGYYMSMNVFNSSGTSFLGPQPFAFDRARMLSGLPATFITPGITNGPAERTYLPADLDGSTLPPAGAPATFVQWPGGGGYRIFHFHVDFATPGNSSFTVFANPAAAGFTQLCPTTRSCVPQSGTTSRLDALGDRLMFRVAYRNFGTHESVVGNYTVSSGSVAGVRWFELRNVTNGPVTVNQESTYQPDSTWRWMGSAAMDRDGNMAIGYSASSSTLFPQLRYAGRLATDPLNVLGQGEATLFAGTGSQVETFNRWGDYASLTVDPVDDCTFWFTSEYYPTTSQFNWRTRIGSFRFPTCGSGSTGSLVATVTADNSYDLYFNGVFTGSGADWPTAQTYNMSMQAGKNVLAIRAADAGGVAGLLADLRVNGQRTGSNTTWKVSLSAPANWTDPNFDDSGWANATDYGAYGVSPWFNNVANMPLDTPGRWIWSSNNNLDDLVFLRVSFGTQPNATAIVTSDNSYDLYFNGVFKGSGADWPTAQTYNMPMQAGKNVLAIRAADAGGLAGLLADLRVNGQRTGSNTTWKVSLSAPSNWTDVNFDDSGWANATDYGAYGVSPWFNNVANMPLDTPGRWIWSSNNNLDDLVFLRVSFGTPQNATAIVTTDNSYDLYFNGVFKGSGSDWTVAQTYTLPTQTGKNVVAIRAADAGGLAGLLAELQVNGQRLGSNVTWKVSLSAPANWTDVNFDDSGWANATDYGAYGVFPWFNNVAGMPMDTPARWIWSFNNDLHDLVFVRVSFNAP